MKTTLSPCFKSQGKSRKKRRPVLAPTAFPEFSRNPWGHPVSVQKAGGGLSQATSENGLAAAAEGRALAAQASPISAPANRPRLARSPRARPLRLAHMIYFLL